MIRYVRGDIFESKCTIRVCPVNCRGVMGKGLALQFKQRYPENTEKYEQWCTFHNEPGDYCAVTIYREDGLPEFIIVNLATKDHWRYPSKLEWINTGLYNLRAFCDLQHAGNSLAIPPLGCGCGGLDWKDVQPLIEKHFHDYNGDVEVYIP